MFMSSRFRICSIPKAGSLSTICMSTVNAPGFPSDIFIMNCSNVSVSCNAFRSAISGPADTQLWEQRGNVGRSMAANFERKGVHWMKCDKGKTQQRNAERLLARLKDHKEGTITPGIVIFRTCPNLIKSLPMIQADPKAPYLPRDTGDQSHFHDSCLYACAYASRGKKGISKVRRQREKWEEDEKKAPRHSTGNYGSVA